MNLARTTLLSALASGVRIVAAVGLNKLFAVYVGPGGFAMLGQFQNYVAMAGTVASGGIGTGIVQMAAESRDDAQRDARVLATSLRITLALGVAVAIASAAASGWLAERMFGSAQWRWLVLLYSAAVALGAVGGWAVSFINGKQAIGTYVAISIASNLASLAAGALLAIGCGIEGALVSVMLAPLFVAVLALPALARLRGFSRAWLRAAWDPPVARGLGMFALMALASGVAGPAVQLAIRERLIALHGWDAAGHWHALTRISDYYLMLITMTLGVYYLPLLSRLKPWPEVLRMVARVGAWVLPAAVLGAAAIFALRDFIVEGLFAASFRPVRDFLPFQLAGDVVKMASWLLGYVLLARGMVGRYIAAELAFSAAYVAASWPLAASHGIEGVTVAYLASYTGYLLLLAAIVLQAARAGEGMHVRAQAGRA